MKVKAKDLTFDRTIYPRAEVNSDTVKAYELAMGGGAEFPPIEIQRVFNYKEEDEEKEFILIVNGVHRWNAVGGDKALVDQEIEAKYWQEEAIAYKENWLELNLRSLELAKKQGKNLVETDKKEQCRRLVEVDETFEHTEEYLAEQFEVGRSTINAWIQDIRLRQRASRESVILRLDMLGWTQDEIGKTVGLAQQTIQEITGNVSFDNFGNFLADGHPIEKAAEMSGYDLTLAWALRIRDMTDLEIANSVAKGGDFEKEKLGFKILPYDYWYFAKCMNLAGRKHPGRIPGQLVLNTLYFFTERGDTVIDPMAGGGVVPDACLLLGRKCYAYDLDDSHGRPDIGLWDLGQGWPKRTAKADLVFFDPPYFKKKETDYVEGSISDLDRESYLAFFDDCLTELKGLVKSGTRLAFLMADWTEHHDPHAGIFVWDYTKLIQEAGWTLVRQIQCPLSTQTIHPDFIVKYRKEKKLNRLMRYLLIAEA